MERQQKAPPNGVGDYKRNYKPALDKALRELEERAAESTELNLRLDQCLKLINRFRRELPPGQFPELMEAAARLIEG